MGERPPILVDHREGSGELIPHLRERGLDAVPGDLVESGGDFSFPGWGPKGLCMVGIERKRPTDLINSMRTNRLVGLQLPRMVEHYDVVYLLIEGIVRSNLSTGLLEQYVGREWREVRLGAQAFEWEDWEKYLTSLEWACRILRSDNVNMTVSTLVAKYRWFQKPWKEHKSLAGLYYQPYPVIPMELSGKEDYLRLVAAAFPHIGPERSLAVIQRFHTVDEMAAATVKQWQEVDGIGRGISRDLWQFIHDPSWGKSK